MRADEDAVAALVAASSAALVAGDVGRMTETLADDITYTTAERTGDRED